MIPKRPPAALQAAIRPLVLSLLLPALLAGCQPLQLGGLLDSGSGKKPPATAQAPVSPLEQARRALAGSNYGQAEFLAQRITDNPQTPQADMAEAGRVLAAAAARNKHPNLALSGLDKWSLAAPGADGGKEWQDLWCDALSQLSPREARTRADAVYRDTSRSFAVRGVAGIYLAVRQWEDGSLGESLPALEGLYSAAPDKNSKALLEGRLATQLSQSTPEALALAAAAVTPENRASFPYNLILIDGARRRTLNADTREAALAELEALRKEIRLADPSLFSGPPAAVTYAPVTSGPISGRPVVLVLPLSGKYGNIADKIAAGAAVACAEMSSAGTAVSLITIDSDRPDWTARLEGLPAEASVVGGPLRREDYATLKARGQLGRRAFLTFLPSLDPGDEGRVAWRFFPGPDDQVDALLRFCSGLGIDGFAALYPDEDYGRRMAGLFEQKAYAAGAKSVHKTAYTPGQPTGWLRAVGNLLAANKNPAHAGGATFRAIFLPDTWKNMDVLVPNIFYYNETRQVLLGTTLWEQDLARAPFVSPQYYSLAVFPGSWNAVRLSPAGERLQAGMLSSGKGPADFWSGLGYDFARLAAGMNVAPGSGPASVNPALRSASLDWSMAPLHWDAAGKAGQDMFLFTPTEGGFAPLDEAAFRRNFAAAWK